MEQPPRIFLTGATGYIGGTLFQTLIDKHPEYDIAVLQRNPKPEFASKYPKVKIIQGDYDSLDILSEAASQADIILHNGDTDHEGCMKALIAGLLKRKDDAPGYLIQLSGTGIISDWQSPTGGSYGNKDPRVWSDVRDIEEIWSQPDSALHRPVDEIIQDAYTAHGDRVRTAIVCGPDVYGKGTGPGKTISILVPFFVEECLKHDLAFYVGEGQNTRSWVHVTDLVRIHLALVEAAVRGGDDAQWNKDGYYFASSQELSQIELATATGKFLHSKGLIESAEPKPASVEQVKQMRSGKFGDAPEIALFMLASSSRTSPDRAKKLFEYRPSAPFLKDIMIEELEAAYDVVKGDGR